MLFVMMLTGSAFAQVITKNGAAALMFPIAKATADELNLHLEPFAFSLIFGCGLSFLSPVAYQTNLMVYGPGGYRFLDFPRIGAPLTILLAALGALLCPLLPNALFPVLPLENRCLEARFPAGASIKARSDEPLPLRAGVSCQRNPIPRSESIRRRASSPRRHRTAHAPTSHLVCRRDLALSKSGYADAGSELHAEAGLVRAAPPNCSSSAWAQSCASFGKSTGAGLSGRPVWDHQDTRTASIGTPACRYRIA